MAVDLSTLPGLSSSLTGGSTKPGAEMQAASDRFLKLLVAQMQNQDPLNPMDNAQVTSQMAQINTVAGIEKLNSTVHGLNGQFMQMQSLQAANLLGREVWLEGNALRIEGGVGEAAFQIASPADRVRVEILSPAGQVVDTLELGAQSAGRQQFSWRKEGVADDAKYSFRVTALKGAAPVSATALMLDRVESVGISGDQLTLALQRSGDVPYTKVLALH